MNTSSWAVFRHLLDQKSEGDRSALLSFLSSDELDKLRQIPPSQKQAFTQTESPANRLEKIHYSWLIPFLEPFAEGDKAMILSALEETQATKLRGYFKATGKLPKTTPLAKRFLLSAMYSWLTSEQKEFLPTDFLPDHPLNPLLDLTKKELQKLVDYLGLHDLAMELKHVIKSEQIKKIQKVLSKEEQSFLKEILKAKEPLAFSRLNLDGWNGDAEKLKTILHHRGFNRLAKALFGCHPSLLWHLTHRLDTGRTKILRKFYTDIRNEEAHDALQKQVLSIIPKVKTSP